MFAYRKEGFNLAILYLDHAGANLFCESIHGNAERIGHDTDTDPDTDTHIY